MYTCICWETVYVDKCIDNTQKKLGQLSCCSRIVVPTVAKHQTSKQTRTTTQHQHTQKKRRRSKKRTHRHLCPNKYAPLPYVKSMAFTYFSICYYICHDTMPLPASKPHINIDIVYYIVFVTSSSSFGCRCCR